MVDYKLIYGPMQYFVIKDVKKPRSEKRVTGMSSMAPKLLFYFQFILKINTMVNNCKGESLLPEERSCFVTIPLIVETKQLINSTVIPNGVPRI